jgi:hypothetical protein
MRPKSGLLVGLYCRELFGPLLAPRRTAAESELVWFMRCVVGYLFGHLAEDYLASTFTAPRGLLTRLLVWFMRCVVGCPVRLPSRGLFGLTFTALIVLLTRLLV